MVDRCRLQCQSRTPGLVMGLARSKSMHKDTLEPQNDGSSQNTRLSSHNLALGRSPGKRPVLSHVVCQTRSTPMDVVQDFPGVAQAFHGQPFLSRVVRVSK